MNLPLPLCPGINAWANKGNEANEQMQMLHDGLKLSIASLFLVMLFLPVDVKAHGMEI